MTELENLFTKGTEGIMIGGKLVYLPVNEDYSFVATIKAYNAAIGKLTVEKVWDQAGSKTEFYAWAIYENDSGMPTADEVTLGSYVVVGRVGKGNNNFTSVPTGPQLHSEASTSKASFVSLFVKETEE